MAYSSIWPAAALPHSGSTHFLQHLEHTMSTLPSTFCDHRVDSLPPLPTALLHRPTAVLSAAHKALLGLPRSPASLSARALQPHRFSLSVRPPVPPLLHSPTARPVLPRDFCTAASQPPHRREVWLGQSVSMQNLEQRGHGAGSRRSRTQRSFLRRRRGAHISLLTPKAARRDPRSLRRRSGDSVAHRPTANGCVS